MINFTAGIGKRLELTVEETQDGIEHGHVFLDDKYDGRRIAIPLDEVRAAARAFELLADMLDNVERQNNQGMSRKEADIMAKRMYDMETASRQRRAKKGGSDDD